MDKALAIQAEVQRILGTDEVYLVGGSVRDIVMGKTPKDYDFSTPLLPDEMEERVRAAGRKVYGIGKQFGTIGFKVPYNVPEEFDDPMLANAFVPVIAYEYVEVTTFRSEIYSSKSRKPEVSFVPDLDEDLARRDFTFNAMILQPNGIIYDPYAGKLDIQDKRIVTVGEPEDRIAEDPLRMLRAARFAARYNFLIDPKFVDKSRQLADRIFEVSVERWVQELDKLLTSDYPEVGLKAMSDMGLLYRILPELEFRHMPRKIDNADEAWKFILVNDTFYYTGEHPRMSPQQKSYINSGICHRLKFSNERTSIIVGRKL